MGFVKDVVRRALPKKLVHAYRDYQHLKLGARNEQMTTEEVFTDIYSKNRWGGKTGTFCSGSGSHEIAIVSPYVSRMTEELIRVGAETKTVVDLGCGDYSVGQQIAPFCGKYIGIDIVRPLIAHNEARYGSASVTFCHANIVEDELPSGDICFVRQVLQHLSNAEIASVLPKLSHFPWCMITEHHPSADAQREPNLDKPHGDDIRVSRGSGVFLDRPPFNIPPVRYRLLFEVAGVPSSDGVDPGVIRTYLLTSDRAKGDSEPS